MRRGGITPTFLIGTHKQSTGTEEGMSSVSAKVETITPNEAENLLAMNTTNRKVLRTRVEQYAKDMLSGNWKLNGEPIIQNGDGTLYNGQHRLLACVKAGVPFATVLVRGVNADSMATIDTGASRSFADYLSISGTQNANIVAGIAVLCMKYDLMVDRDLNQLPSGAGFVTSRLQQIEYVGLPEHKEVLAHTVDVILTAKKLLPGRPSHFGFVHFIASRDCKVPQRKIDDFVAYACDPAGLAETEAPRLLRSVLLANQAKAAHTKSSPTLEAALTAKAMSWWIAGREGQILTWKRGSGRKGSKTYKEAFPRIA